MTVPTTREQACEHVLAAVLLTPAALDILTDEGVTPDQHWQPALTAAHRAMLALHDQGQAITPVTLTHQLQTEHTGPGQAFTDPTQAAALVDRLNGPVPALGELRSYCRIVRTEHEWDQRGRLLTDAGTAIHNRDQHGFDAALTGLTAADPSTTQSTRSPEDLLSDFADWYEDKEQAGIPLPFDHLTKLLRGGLRPGDTTVLAGWPGHGKTALVSQMAYHAATVVGAECHEYVNEMSSVDRTARMLARLTGIPFDRVITRDCSLEEVGKLLKAGRRLPGGMTECSGWSADRLAREIRRHKHDLAVVDLVTRIPARDTRDWDQVSGTLTDAARQSGTHLILVCQLNLERCKTAVRPAPTGRDLRNTGAWYQDARVVMFVHRDQELLDGDVADPLLEGHIRIEKATNGVPGIQQVRFDPARMRFVERPTGLKAVA